MTALQSRVRSTFPAQRPVIECCAGYDFRVAEESNIDHVSRGRQSLDKSKNPRLDFIVAADTAASLQCFRRPYTVT